MSARPPCPTPADCWGWLRPEEAIRIALGAYYAACRAIQSPPNEPWIVDGDSYADRENFRDELALAFIRRLHAAAIEAGLGPPGASFDIGAAYPELRT